MAPEFVDHVPSVSAPLRPGSALTLWLVTEDRDLSLPYTVRIGEELELVDDGITLREALEAAGGLRGFLVTLDGEPASL